MLRFFIIALIISMTLSNVSGQTSDLARIEYSYFPQSDSDNSFRRFRSLINLPIKIADNSYIVAGLEYRNINLKIGDVLNFSDKNLERLQSYGASVGYTFLMSENWRFGAQLGMIVASNFTTHKVINDDYLVQSSIYFIRSRKDRPNGKKEDRLIVGLQYSTTAGRPFPLPVINYHRKISSHWEYTVGVPKTLVRYRFNENHALQAYITLDGFFANIQNEINIGTEIAENISMTTVLGGMGYEYCFTDHLLYYLYAGYTVFNDIRLRNAYGEDIFTLNNQNSIYLRSGIKFKI